MRLTLTILLLFALQTHAAEVGLKSTFGADDIIFSGQIMTGDATKVGDLIKKISGDGKVHRFIIHSPGGNVTEAIAIGDLLRQDRFSVYEPSGLSCISACVFAIAGGVQRVLLGKVGLHRPYLPNNFESTPLVSLVQADAKKSMSIYMEKMGVKTSIVDAMYAIESPSEIRYLGAQEMKAYRLSTEDEM